MFIKESISQPVQSIIVYGIIIVVLAGIAVGRLPRFRMNRASLAFAGAALLIVFGGILPEEALKAVDLGTLLLILSMMIITANLKFSGFFELAGVSILSAAGTPRRLLLLIMVGAAVFSAFFLNDTVCILMTPLVAGLTLKAKRNPVPYLIGLALSSNIGSAATIIGNPQNMLIGAASGVPFLRFTAFLLVPSAVGVVIAYFCTRFMFRSEFGRTDRLDTDGVTLVEGREPKIYKPLFYKSLAAIVLMIVCFIINLPVYEAAMSAAAVLLTTRRIKPERVFRELDWTIIAFFGGLFVITTAVARTEAFQWFVEKGMPLVNGNLVHFSVFTLVLSNLVSNVPAVMLMRPLVAFFENPEKAWLVMALASTYAGNLTLLGSVANLIVAEGAKRRGIEIRFGTYLRVGIPVTVITIALGTAWLLLI